jgi:hypothetical protein
MAFHASVGNLVDLLWQTVDGKPTAVGMIVKANGPAAGSEHAAAVSDKGGLVYAEAATQPAGGGEEAAGAGANAAANEVEQPAGRLVAPPWPTGAQENPDPLDANWGSLYGFVTGKGGGEFIDVCPVGDYNDGNSVSVRFAPAQVRPATATDDGLDVRVREQIRLIPAGAPVEVFWVYNDGKRAVRIVPATQNGVMVVR